MNKTVEVKYETGYHFKITYLSDHKLRWESQKERTDGAPMSGEETYYLYDQGNDLYMISWIEESGLVVSQVLDFNKNTVYAFMTWEDDKERGKRGLLSHSGIILGVEDNH